MNIIKRYLRKKTELLFDDTSLVRDVYIEPSNGSCDFTCNISMSKEIPFGKNYDKIRTIRVIVDDETLIFEGVRAIRVSHHLYAAPVLMYSLTFNASRISKE